MKKTLIISGILASLVIIGMLLLNEKKPIKEIKTEKLTASLRLGWIPSASFSGEYAGQEKFDENYNLDLKCNPGGPGLNSIQLVVSGDDNFGTIAADEVIAANEKGADLVIIGVINYYSPGAFISLKKNNITKPIDFINKKVGMLPFGSTTILYESLISKNNVDRKKITEITVSPDLKLFVNGIYDVHPVFVYDETVTLDLQNIEYNVIEPKDFGVKVKGPVYFCKRELLEKEPELIKAFINTVADGWNFALENNDESIVILKKYANEINVERESLVLKKLKPYFSAYNNQPLNSDVESWNETIKILNETGRISEKVDLKRLLSFENINNYYIKK